jgi:hypothetical protein
MRKLFVLVGLVVLAGSMMMAQEVPTAEAYAGFSFIRVNTAGNVNSFTPTGGLGSFQVNFNKNFGVVAEFGGTHKEGNSIAGPDRPLEQTQFTYLFGPRVFFNKAGRYAPFFEYLVGGVHNSRSFPVPNSAIPLGFVVPRGVTVDVGATTTRFRTTQNAFGMAIGGGLDIKLSKVIAVRPIQLDYMPTHFSPLNIPGVGQVFGADNSTRWQQNLRYSGGITFRFGSGIGY